MLELRWRSCPEKNPAPSASSSLSSKLGRRSRVLSVNFDTRALWHFQLSWPELSQVSSCWFVFFFSPSPGLDGRTRCSWNRDDVHCLHALCINTTSNATCSFPTARPTVLLKWTIWWDKSWLYSVSRSLDTRLLTQSSLIWCKRDFMLETCLRTSHVFFWPTLPCLHILWRQSGWPLSSGTALVLAVCSLELKFLSRLHDGAPAVPNVQLGPSDTD